MSPMPEVSEKAVEAMARARHGRALCEHWADVGGERRMRLLEEARLDLEAALPHLTLDEPGALRELMIWAEVKSDMYRRVSESEMCSEGDRVEARTLSTAHRLFVDRIRTQLEGEQ